jgi:fermentation-respiration switch protein FrsA (DUF1100 family)
MSNVRKILIVDDDTELREALVEQLALHEEFEAEAVDSGAKGVQSARNGHIDLEVTLRSLERLLDYAPGLTIDRIAPTPLLLIAAEQDFLPIDIAERAFARAGEPKRFCRLAAGHFSGYEPPLFETAAREAVEWFTRYL